MLEMMKDRAKKLSGYSYKQPTDMDDDTYKKAIKMLDQEKYNKILNGLMLEMQELRREKSQ